LVLTKYKEILKKLKNVNDDEKDLIVLEKWLENNFENDMLTNEALFDNAMEIFNTYMDKDKCAPFVIENYQLIL